MTLNGQYESSNKLYEIGSANFDPTIASLYFIMYIPTPVGWPISAWLSYTSFIKLKKEKCLSINRRKIGIDKKNVIGDKKKFVLYLRVFTLYRLYSKLDMINRKHIIAKNLVRLFFNLQVVDYLRSWIFLRTF